MSVENRIYSLLSGIVLISFIIFTYYKCIQFSVVEKLNITQNIINPNRIIFRSIHLFFNMIRVYSFYK